METIVCQCGEELGEDAIQIEEKHNLDIAYMVCHECSARYNLMFDNRETRKLKGKIKTARAVLHYLQTLLYKQMLVAEDSYYRAEYDMLSKEEQERVGGYHSTVDEKKLKEYDAIIKKGKPTIREVVKMLP